MSNPGGKRAPDRPVVVWIADDDIAAARRLFALLGEERSADQLRPGDRRLALDRARSSMFLRQRRLELLGEEFAAEPPFALIVALYAGEKEESEMSPTRLSQLTALPMTTAIRWIEDLANSGWVDRRELPRRKTRISLTDKTRRALDELFSWPQ